NSIEVVKDNHLNYKLIVRRGPVMEMPNLVGGALCLDFVNTVDPRHAPGRREYLDSYPALAGWGSHAGAIDAAQGERLREAAAGVPAEGDRVLGRAIRRRE